MRNLYYIPQPAKERDPEHSSEFRAKALKSWIACLPTANHGMTTRLFHDHVKLLNETSISVEELFDALEMLFPTYTVIEDFLVSRILGRSFPLAADEQKIGELAETICRDYLVGYSVVLKEWSGASAGWRSTRLLPRVICRIMRGLSRVLVARYILRIPEPEWIWLDLHSLYQLAERKNKISAKIREGESGKSTSVESLYKQILLLQSLDPGGMTHREILSVYAKFAEWSQHLRFEDSWSNTSPTRRWVVLDEDQPAILSPDTDSGRDENCRLISFDLENLVSVLQNMKAVSDPAVGRFDLVSGTGDSSPEYSAVFLDYMIARFETRPTAGKVSVFEDQKPRLLSIGLKATHQQLNPPANPEEKIIGDWLITVNEDDSLRCEFDQPGQLFLGSLVSTRRVDLEGGRRVLGIVNRIWMHRLSGAVHFDIAVLSPQVIAAGIQPVRVKKDLQVYQRVLLYFEQTETGQQPRLILESQKLRGGNTVQLLTHNESVRVILENRRNVGPGYSLFECVPLAEEKQEIIPPKGYDFL